MTSPSSSLPPLPAFAESIHSLWSLSLPSSSFSSSSSSSAHTPTYYSSSSVLSGQTHAQTRERGSDEYTRLFLLRSRLRDAAGTPSHADSALTSSFLSLLSSPEYLRFLSRSRGDGGQREGEERGEGEEEGETDREVVCVSACGEEVMERVCGYVLGFAGYERVEGGALAAMAEVTAEFYRKFALALSTLGSLSLSLSLSLSHFSSFKIDPSLSLLSLSPLSLFLSLPQRTRRRSSLSPGVD